MSAAARRLTFASGLVLPLLAIFLPAQTVAKTTTFNKGWFWSSWTYDYTVTNAGGGGAAVLTQVCIDFPGGLNRIDSVSSPPGWTPTQFPGAVPPYVCWTAPAGGGIPPGGTLAGFSATTVCGGNPYIEGRQAFAVWSGGPEAWIPKGGGTTTDNMGSAQTLPRGFDRAAAGGNTANPWASTGNQRLQHVYDSSELPQQPIRIRELWVRPASAAYAGPGGAFTTFDVTLASSLNDFTALSPVFAANPGADATLVRSGPLVVPPIPASVGTTAAWIRLGITNPFVFDPCLGRDLLVEIRKCGSGNMGAAVESANDGSRARTVRNVTSPTACTDPVATSTSLFAPLFRIDFELIQPVWQVNFPGARLRIGPEDCGGTEMEELARAILAIEPAVLDSRNPGMPWDLGVTPGPGVPANRLPGVFTPGGQALNLDVFAPGFRFLLGGTFSQPFVPQTVPVTSAVPLAFSAQLAVVDPQLPDGVALSALSRVRFLTTPGGSVAGPAGDDTSVAVALASIGAAPVPFLGTAFDVMHVGSNGRVTFIGADTDWTPTAAEALNRFPFAGAWCDLNPAAGGTISVAATTGGDVQVTYANVPYFGQPALGANLAIAFDLASGSVTLSGLSTFPMHPSASGLMFLGLSPGAEGEATDPGPTAFAPGGPHPGPANHGMTYALGRAGTLAPGVDTLRFDPSGNGSYSWTGF